jgi:hypothetical protein
MTAERGQAVQLRLFRVSVTLVLTALTALCGAAEVVRAFPRSAARLSVRFRYRCGRGVGDCPDSSGLMRLDL